MSVAKVARIWQSAGVSVIPILDNQTKRPAVRWSPYQVALPTLGEVEEWWGNGKPYGLALICGGVSGNLEMVEIEGRARNDDSMVEIENRMDEHGARHVWDRLTGPEGYSEMSPSGGIHLLYRISDHEVPGNTKIAGSKDGLCLAETRGHGGYVIVAPTLGVCHPSGEPWDLLDGQYGKLPLITWTERELIHEALRLALDESPPPPPTPATLPGAPPAPGSSVAGLSPGDDFENRMDWSQILEPHGWTLESRRGDERHWTRPGKDRRQGMSATTGHADDRERLWVFSSSTLFQTDTTYTKFAAYALLDHGGDYSAAAKRLTRLGFGSRPVPPPLDPLVIDSETAPAPSYMFDEPGNAERLWDRVRGNFHFVYETKQFACWNGRTWGDDCDGALVREMTATTMDMLAAAANTLNEALAKWARASRSRARITASIDLMRSQDECTKKVRDFDIDRHLLNLANGILDLKTHILLPPDPMYMMTRLFSASYNPQATCPQFNEFIRAALPDDEMRSYVQRALGYSLLGDVDQRSVFWIYGPPGTGKSTLMDTMRNIFGDYGITAPSGTFRSRGKEHGPTNDLHGLRNKRFVTSSETAESSSFDEDLLKRLSGRDQVTSRALYQENIEWTPECVIWMATNNPPRFNSDDDAIWRRTKLVPFTTVFVGENEIPDMARRILAPERDGILNWLLAGLSEYMAIGLNEPASVQEAAHEQRLQSDSVARFMEDRISDGVLILGSDEKIRTTELHTMYIEWARQVGERPLGSKRVYNRITSAFPHLAHTKYNGQLFWYGIGRHPLSSILGTMVPPFQLTIPD